MTAATLPFTLIRAAIVAGLVLLAQTGHGRAAPLSYPIDPQSAAIHFEARGFGFLPVRGQFAQFRGTLQVDPQAPLASRIAVAINSTDIDTAWPGVAPVLRSAPYLNADQFPEIAFQSTGVRQGPDNHLLIDGTLVIRGVSRPEVLDVELAGGGKPDAAGKVAVVARTSLSRADFGMVADRPAVGDKVSLTINAQLVAPQG